MVSARDRSGKHPMAWERAHAGEPSRHHASPNVFHGIADSRLKAGSMIYLATMNVGIIRRL